MKRVWEWLGERDGDIAQLAQANNVDGNGKGLPVWLMKETGKRRKLMARVFLFVLWPVNQHEETLLAKDKERALELISADTSWPDGVTEAARRITQAVTYTLDELADLLDKPCDAETVWRATNLKGCCTFLLRSLLFELGSYSPPEQKVMEMILDRQRRQAEQNEAENWQLMAVKD